MEKDTCTFTNEKFNLVQISQFSGAIGSLGEGGGGTWTDDSAEILFKSFLQEEIIVVRLSTNENAEYKTS